MLLILLKILVIFKISMIECHCLKAFYFEIIIDSWEVAKNSTGVLHNITTLNWETYIGTILVSSLFRFYGF